MALLVGMLCQLWRCTAYGPRRRERAPEKAEPSRSAATLLDDLTAIRGIGIATQNRLYLGGIKSYGQLARATPEEVRKILGKLEPYAKAEEWIAQARELAEKK